MEFSIAMKNILAIFSAAFFAAHCALAVIVYGVSNAGASVDYGGSANAAQLSVVSVGGSGSAVYLGNGWFITANHVSVGIGTKVYQNGLFAVVDMVDSQLHSYNDYSADLKMFHVGDADDLAYLQPVKVDADILSSVSVSRWNIFGKFSYGSELLLVGAGYGRASDEDLSATVVEGSIAAAGVHSGTITLLSKTQKLYGADSEPVPYNFLMSMAESKTGRAQALLRDSGAGMFYYKDGDWYLLGTVVSVDSTESQTCSTFGAYTTSSADYSAYSRTFAIDLSEFSDKINEIAATGSEVPEPASAAAMLAAAALAAALALRRTR